MQTPAGAASSAELPGEQQPVRASSAAKPKQRAGVNSAAAALSTPASSACVKPATGTKLRLSATPAAASSDAAAATVATSARKPPSSSQTKRSLTSRTPATGARGSASTASAAHAVTSAAVAAPSASAFSPPPTSAWPILRPVDVLSDLQSLAALSQLQQQDNGSSGSASTSSAVPDCFASAPAPLLHSWSTRADLLRDCAQPLQEQAGLMAALTADMESVLAQARAYLQGQTAQQPKMQQYNSPDAYAATAASALAAPTDKQLQLQPPPPQPDRRQEAPVNSKTGLEPAVPLAAEYGQEVEEEINLQ